MEINKVNAESETNHCTTVERKSNVEIVVTRTFAAKVSVLFEAWTNPDFFRQWWVPKSYGLNLRSCEMDVRVGGKYRLVFLHEGSEMEFFGTYLEVVKDSRLVWTNEEDDAGQTITTVTFESKGDESILTLTDRYPTEDSVQTGSSGAMPEVFEQLAELLASSN